MRIPTATLRLTILLGLLLGGCAPAPEPVPPPPAEMPPLHQGDDIWRLDPDRSGLTLLVARDGPLARLGHNHVIVHRALVGTARPDRDVPEVLLQFETGSLEVDPPDARARHPDFADSDPDTAAIAATRANMLGPDLLDADRHPLVAVQGRLTAAGEAALLLQVRGRLSTARMPVTIEREGPAFRVRGRADLSLDAMGLEPFAVLGGALRVADALVCEVDLLFVPAAPGTRMTAARQACTMACVDPAGASQP